MRVPVTPDTAVAAWALHELEMAKAMPKGASLLASVRRWQTVTHVMPANGIDAVGVERDGEGWAWIVEDES